MYKHDTRDIGTLIRVAGAGGDGVRGSGSDVRECERRLSMTPACLLETLHDSSVPILDLESTTFRFSTPTPPSVVHSCSSVTSDVATMMVNVYYDPQWALTHGNV